MLHYFFIILIGITQKEFIIRKLGKSPVLANNFNVLYSNTLSESQKEELKNILKDKFTLFSDYYNINEYGYWENNKYVLIRNKKDVDIANKYNISEDELVQLIQSCKSELINIFSPVFRALSVAGYFCIAL